MAVFSFTDFCHFLYGQKATKEPFKGEEISMSLPP